MRDYRTIRYDPPSSERGGIYLQNLFDRFRDFQYALREICPATVERIAVRWASSKVTDTKPMCNPKELPKLKKKSTVC